MAQLKFTQRRWSVTDEASKFDGQEIRDIRSSCIRQLSAALDEL